MWYHEAVPGHHLQCATVIIEKDRLSRFQRTEAWTSGYGEGWALYAERFMDELGAFDDPGFEMGFLSAQAMRAARVVVDIGLHLGYEDGNGKVWNYDSAVALLISHALLDEDFAKSEVERYLGIGGQAISYKVGERVWINAREDAKKRLGDRFSLIRLPTNCRNGTGTELLNSHQVLCVVENRWDWLNRRVTDYHLLSHIGERNECLRWRNRIVSDGSPIA